MSVFHLALSNMAQRHMPIVAVSVIVPFMSAKLPFLSAMLLFMCALFPF